MLRKIIKLLFKLRFYYKKLNRVFARPFITAYRRRRVAIRRAWTNFYVAGNRRLLWPVRQYFLHWYRPYFRAYYWVRYRTVRPLYQWFNYYDEAYLRFCTRLYDKIDPVLTRWFDRLMRWCDRQHPLIAFIPCILLVVFGYLLVVLVMFGIFYGFFFVNVLPALAVSMYYALLFLFMYFLCCR